MSWMNYPFHFHFELEAMQDLLPTHRRSQWCWDFDGFCEPIIVGELRHVKPFTILIDAPIFVQPF